MPRRKYYRGFSWHNASKKRVLFVLKLSGCGVLLTIIAVGFLFAYYAITLPRPENFTEKQVFLPTKIYDRTGGVLLYEIYGEEKRTVVPLDAIPDNVKHAIIATEDANFYQHFGLDPRGLLRAILANLKLREPAQGASTISQQLIRSSFLSREKTISRKIKEIILTLELERHYPKDKILEFYLNQIPFGENSYGVEAASQTYFNKPTKDVSTAEAAILAALIHAPSRLSPSGSHYQELMDRKNYVLTRMEKTGYITREEKELAQQEELRFIKSARLNKAPHFVIAVRDYLIDKYGEDFLKENGLRVYTSLNWDLQEEAEKDIREGAKANEAFRAYNASLVSIDPRTGEILAMVGSKDYFADSYPEGCRPGINCLFDPQVNVATYNQGRQPGSAFKPFAYTLAIQGGLTPETILWDVKTEFNPDCGSSADQIKDKYGLDCYHPLNYDGKFRGPIDLRRALAQSINVPSVKVLYLAGVPDVISLAKNFGITTLNQPLSWYGLSLVLGGGEVKLLDITSAYGVFAADGFAVPPVSILKIENSRGDIIEENKKSPKRALEERVARTINDILSDNDARAPIFGLRSMLYFPDYQVAAKTGTTQDFKDGWIIGYTPSIVTGVWVGNNNNDPMAKEPGAVLAGPIWHNFMNKALNLRPKESFIKPYPTPANKPILQGEIDKNNPHSILFYISKDNPTGEPPGDPSRDPQYNNWEAGVKNWVLSNFKI